LIFQYSRDKILQFLGERAHVTPEEEIERFVGADAVFRAYFYVGGFLIDSCRAALRAEYLDALVRAICRFAAVVYDPDGSGRKLQGNDCCVEVPRFADLWINQDGSLGIDLLHIAAREVAGHVKAMDGHIHDNSSRYLDVFDRRRCRVVACYLHDM